jgi:hypothetical protein
MDYANISKAIAGGITGAVAATGGAGVVYFSLPPGTNLPEWVYTAVPVINALVGFAIGFLGVYHAPANKPASVTSSVTAVTPKPLDK